MGSGHFQEVMMSQPRKFDWEYFAYWFIGYFVICPLAIFFAVYLRGPL